MQEGKATISALQDQLASRDALMAAERSLQVRWWCYGRICSWLCMARLLLAAVYPLPLGTLLQEADKAKLQAQVFSAEAALLEVQAALSDKSAALAQLELQHADLQQAHSAQVQLLLGDLENARATSNSFAEQLSSAQQQAAEQQTANQKLAKDMEGEVTGLHRPFAGSCHPPATDVELECACDMLAVCLQRLYCPAC
jgi:hypothetical protein